MESGLSEIGSTKMFDGYNKRYKHYSETLGVFHDLYHLLPIGCLYDLNGYTGVVSMPPNNVKVLHVLGYRGTAEELKHLKSLLGEFQCLELVQVGVKQEDNSIILQTYRDLMTLLGVSVSS